ncbi:MAG: porin family protein [Bacteroidales bacterium]
MNKPIKISLLLIMLTATISAEAKLFSYGLKGGITLSSLSLSNSFKSNFSADNRTGFFIGPVVQLNIPLGFGVDGAVLYSQDNIKIEDTLGSLNHKRRMIEIPVNIKWSINLAKVIGVYATAGPNFLFNLSSDSEINDYLANNLSANGESPSKLVNESKTTTIGISLGAGLILLNHLNIGFNYIIPLQESYKFTIDGTKELFSSKDKRWQISAAYMF